MVSVVVKHHVLFPFHVVVSGQWPIGLNPVYSVQAKAIVNKRKIVIRSLRVDSRCCPFLGLYAGIKLLLVVFLLYPTTPLVR